jgi:DNA-binding HxlR family transcriptional regulator
MAKAVSLDNIRHCPKSYALAINDTMNVISGKWKLSILGTLMCGSKRFTDIQKNIATITPRMLSKELKELELNGMVERCVYDTKPVSVEYTLTKSAQSFHKVLDQMIAWGLQHRKIQIKMDVKSEERLTV